MKIALLVCSLLVGPLSAQELLPAASINRVACPQCQRPAREAPEFKPVKGFPLLTAGKFLHHRLRNVGRAFVGLPTK